MPLINLKTNLKSLKFGKDRPGGGSSNQPYIKSKIPDQDSDQSNIFNTGGPDSLLRGGILAPIRAAEDTSRLTQMFFDTKSPTGLLFTTKQNTLSRLSVHTEASSGAGYGAGKLNQGVYLPTSTIAQSAVGITGTHLNTFGIDPSSPMTGGGGGLFSIGLKRYEDVVRRKNEDENNRLVEYLDIYINKKNNSPLLSEITGGPGSILGIGKSLISFTKQRTGENNNTLKPYNKKDTTDNFIDPIGKTKYGSILNEYNLDRSIILGDVIKKTGGITWNNITALTAYEPGSLTPTPDLKSKYNSTPNPQDDYISPLGKTNYGEVLGIESIDSDIILADDLKKGSKTWNNQKSQTVYESGSLELNSSLTNPTKQDTKDDLISPTGSTNYGKILEDELNTNISKDGGSWKNNKAQTVYESGSLSPNKLLETPKKKNTSKDFISTSGSIKTNDGKTFNLWEAIGEETTFEPNKSSINKPGIFPLEKDNEVIKKLKNQKPNQSTDDFISPTGSTDYGKKLGNKLNTNISSNGSGWLNVDAQKVYKSGSLELESDNEVTGTTTWTQQQINSVEQGDLGRVQDFRDKINLPPTNKKILGKLANIGYNSAIRIENRVHSGDPGKSKDVSKYGVAYKGAPLDKITASEIYNATIANHSGEKNDLCKFSIGVINNDKTGTSNFMHFRAFIDSFNDSYTAEWGDTQYVGRADKFYNYKGFGRNVSLSFTVAAQSKAELIPMYKKLNYLASSLAPSYSQGGFMQGNLIRLTIGGYLYNQVGILKGITYTIPQSSPWEIGLDDKVANDNSVKELPHMIQVTGFEFIPIQDFVPQVGNYQNQVKTRFISLANGSGEGNNNYNNS